MTTVSTLAANKVHISYREQLMQLAHALSSHPFLRQKEMELRAIANNLQAPFNIAIFGRMKTGKSTLINALMGKQLAITGVEETTATINRITYATGERLKQFTIHWQDAQPETQPLERLQEGWCGKSEEVKERARRTSWLELYSDAPALKDIHLTDTPGTGATAVGHETIAKQFINGQAADALLYVFSATGRESDEIDLQTFRAGCLPGSSLDNSVAVLHKWDHIFWDEDDWDSICSKAKSIHQFMGDLVSTVIPVSAPLALLAKTAPPSFWENCNHIISTFDDEEEFIEVLGDDEEWEEEEPRRMLYQQANDLGCPLPSFRIALRHIFRHPDAPPAELLYALSGLQKLESVLDCQIFSKRTIIQQKQNCARARRVMDEVYDAIEEEIAHQTQEIDTMACVMEHLTTEQQLLRWMDNKRANQIEQLHHLQSAYKSIDRMRTRIGEWSDAITNAHDLIPWLEEYERLGLTQQVAQDFTGYVKSMLPNAETPKNISLQHVVTLLPQINRLHTLPSVMDKAMATKLHKTIMQWIGQQHI